MKLIQHHPAGFLFRQQGFGEHGPNIPTSSNLHLKWIGNVKCDLKSFRCSICTDIRKAKYLIDNVPVVPVRGGAEVALKIYMRPFSSIELACAVHQPSPCVRALCEVVSCCTCHISSHFTVHTSHFSLLTASFTLQTSHFTLHTSHFTLRSSHSKLQTSHSTLQTSHSTLHTSQFTLLTSHCFLHTSHFTLHSSRPTLHTALNLRATPVPCKVKQALSSHFTSELFSSAFMSSHMRATFFYFVLVVI